MSKPNKQLARKPRAAPITGRRKLGPDGPPAERSSKPPLLGRLPPRRDAETDPSLEGDSVDAELRRRHADHPGHVTARADRTRARPLRQADLCSDDGSAPSVDAPFDARNFLTSPAALAVRIPRDAEPALKKLGIPYRVTDMAPQSHPVAHAVRAYCVKSAIGYFINLRKTSMLDFFGQSSRTVTLWTEMTEDLRTAAAGRRQTNPVRFRITVHRAIHTAKDVIRIGEATSGFDVLGHQFDCMLAVDIYEADVNLVCEQAARCGLAIILQRRYTEPFGMDEAGGYVVRDGALTSFPDFHTAPYHHKAEAPFGRPGMRSITVDGADRYVAWDSSPVGNTDMNSAYLRVTDEFVFHKTLPVEPEPTPVHLSSLGLLVDSYFPIDSGWLPTLATYCPVLVESCPIHRGLLGELRTTIGAQAGTAHLLRRAERIGREFFDMDAQSLAALDGLTAGFPSKVIRATIDVAIADSMETYKRSMSVIARSRTGFSILAWRFGIRMLLWVGALVALAMLLLWWYFDTVVSVCYGSASMLLVWRLIIAVRHAELQFKLACPADYLDHGEIYAAARPPARQIPVWECGQPFHATDWDNSRNASHYWSTEITGASWSDAYHTAPTVHAAPITNIVPLSTVVHHGRSLSNAMGGFKRWLGTYEPRVDEWQGVELLGDMEVQVYSEQEYLNSVKNRAAEAKALQEIADGYDVMSASAAPHQVFVKPDEGTVPKLDNEPGAKPYSKPRIIITCRDQANAFVGPWIKGMHRELRRRFPVDGPPEKLGHWNTVRHYGPGASLEELEQFFTRAQAPRPGECFVTFTGDDIEIAVGGKRARFAGTDFSAYDQSQNEGSIMAEMDEYTAAGMPGEVVSSLIAQATADLVYVDAKAGVSLRLRNGYKGRKRFYRVTGGKNTTVGNTTTTMRAVSHAIRLMGPEFDFELLREVLADLGFSTKMELRDTMAGGVYLKSMVVRTLDGGWTLTPLLGRALKMVRSREDPSRYCPSRLLPITVRRRVGASLFIDGIMDSNRHFVSHPMFAALADHAYSCLSRAERLCYRALKPMSRLIMHSCSGQLAYLEQDSVDRSAVGLDWGPLYERYELTPADLDSALQQLSGLDMFVAPAECGLFTRIARLD